MCSYRGYGQSAGSPSEQGLKQDAQAALDYLLGRKQGKGKVAPPCCCQLGTVFEPPNMQSSTGIMEGEAGASQAGQSRAPASLMQLRPVVPQVAVLGKSLGGAVALYLAAARQATMQAVIVENTFTSLEELAPKVRPPGTWLAGIVHGP